MRDENREDVLGTRSLLESNFINELKKTGQKTGNIKKITSVDFADEKEKHDFSTEKVLVSLYEVRDELIECFNHIDTDSVVYQSLTGSIEKLGNCINTMGGDVEPFNPLDHATGLASPDMNNNAQKVIDNTKQFYSAGKIKNISASDNGQTIDIILLGNTKNNRKYSVTGKITANSPWCGNEAIDYVYTPGSGKLSVKIFEDGKWLDKSSSYKIKWELEENDELQENPQEQKHAKTQPEKNVNIKKESATNNKKDIDSDEDLSFPIRDK